MPDAVDVVVGLGRALQAAGVPAGPDRVQQAVRALAALDPTQRREAYWAGRLTCCAGPDDIARYDRVFEAWFSGVRPRLASRTSQPSARPGVVRLPSGHAAADDETEAPGESATVLRAAASRIEVLRHRDIAALSADDRNALRRALAALTLPGELRPSRRFRPAHGGPVDPVRTARELVRAGGEPARLRYRRHRKRPRRVVLLVDISGSMSPYADTLLRFAHAASLRRGVRTEVFTLGTRLTHITRDLGSPDPERAMAAIADAVPDWSGGTRLGELLREFLDRWGQRGMARGAIVVILSDGWERGDARPLGAQMARLSRLAHRVVWANPRKGTPGYAPLAAGMAAALPYVDDFVAGHSLAALERLAAVVAGAGGGPVAGSVQSSGTGVRRHA